MGKYLRMFRRIVRKVIANLIPHPNILEDEYFKGSSAFIWLSKTNDIGRLTNDFKMTLLKPPDSRTREDILEIFKLTHKFKYFKHFPDEVIYNLARYIRFCWFTPNRTIFRKGNVARNIYFVLNGQCVVSVEEYDPITQQYTYEMIRVLRGGTSFGDDEVFQNALRTYTVLTASPVELLVLSAEDLNGVLENTIKRNWEIMDGALKHFTYFDTFNATTKRECFLVSKIVTYEKGQTILSSNVGRRDLTHFILSGECQVIEHIFVKRKVLYDDDEVGKSPARKKFSTSTGNELMSRAFQEPSEILIKENELRKSFTNSFYTSSKPEHETVQVPINTETYFMQVCIYSELACFNIGENMKNRSVVSLTPLTCLLIPKYWLLTNNLTICSKIRLYLNSRLPSNDEVYNELLQQQKFRQYKKDLLSGLLKKPPCNSYMNIPYSIRIRQDFDYSKIVNSNKRN